MEAVIEEVIEPGVPEALALVLGTVFVLSFSALFFLFQKHVSGRPLLAYEPRRRVPWGPMVVVLAMGMPLLGVLAYIAGIDSTDQPPAENGAAETEVISVEEAVEQPPAEKMSTQQMLINGWGSFSFMVCFVFGVAAWLSTCYRADAHDLGLPTSWQQAFQDIGIGCLATVAALLPIYAIQLTLIFSMKSETKHPLVEQLEQNHSPAMLLLGIAMAVIAAPLFEEFTFRGLLQGWLERREDEVLAYHTTASRQPVEIADDGSNKPENDFVYVHQTLAETLDNRHHNEEFHASETTTTTERPPHGWIPALPHGWTPILISGFAFGLAHIGHGVAPVSLILFGIVLGYLYQRTHRLLPSITAHMLFNGYSMLLLWIQLDTPPTP